ncbi:TonB-dependent siderophore receptor [Sphingosinicella soli]|uniref:Outer membrane receptor for ferric coprogen and ferric-rhodotorulic acid n=1 Tax=Sphingosinicella soli TaxID=333708 RepID=A0A7W7B674_9SPHN|nr:outer membrane receptor for ferric coprogen and ferric-rhodotorulic acid [Sphingosinicella soli]
MNFASSFRAGLLLGLPLLAVPAYADDTDAEERRRSEIVVTGIAADDSYAPESAAVAGKRPAPILEIPQSISVVTREQIEDRNLFTIGEAVQQVTGVTVMPFDGSNPDYRARGFVLDYAYDGVPSTFSSGVPEFDLVIYERIEIQRGPTGLFRGAGSPGGTINLIRKRGQNEFSMSAALSAGSWNNYRGEFDIGGPVDAAGKLRVRAVGSLLDRDFFQKKSHTRKFVAYGAIDYDLTPTTTIGASISYQDNEANTPQNGQPAFTNQQFLGFPRSFQHLPDWNLFTDTTVEYAAEVEQRFGRWALKVRALERDIPRAWMDAFIQPGTGVDPDTLTANYVNRRSDGQNRKQALDAYATGPFALFGREHELAIGYSYDRRTTSFLSRSQTVVGRYSIFDADSIPQPSAAFTQGSETDLRQSGFHAQARLRILDPLTVVLGGRISDFTNKSRNILPSAVTDFRVTSRERGKFTPSVGAVLYLTDNVTLYGSYSDIFNPQTALRQDGTTIDPRVGQQYEVGLKGRFLDGKLNTAAAVFRSKDKNRALADASAPGFFVPAGEVSIEGFEFEITGSPLEGLDVNLGYTNVKTEYEVGTATQTGTVFDIFTPRHQFKGYARYEPAALGGAFASVGVNAQSKVVGAGVAGIREQGSFAVANAQLGYRFNEHLRAFATVNNLFDKVYYVRVGSLNTYNNYGEPRSVLLTLRAKY